MRGPATPSSDQWLQICKTKPLFVPLGCNPKDQTPVSEKSCRREVKLKQNKMCKHAAAAAAAGLHPHLCRLGPVGHVGKLTCPDLSNFSNKSNRFKLNYKA